MCGLTAIISKKKINTKKFRTANSNIKHRGPDNENYFDSKNLKKKNKLNFLFGFQRLNIIDLHPRSNQPFFYREKYIILFNGEIYNYIEIKNYLKKKKIKFKTTSDTEVLAAAYEYWGDKCFDKFHGMWSSIIYDLKNLEFTISRDRYGVKPLYYLNLNNDEIIFGSEIKQLLPYLNKRKINKKLIYDYLSNDLQNHTDECFFENIFQVSKGGLIKIDKDLKINFDQWYQFPKIINKVSEKDLKKKLFKSVSMRLRSDTKVGISLSGGIDSTSIASITAKIKKKDHKKILTFSTITEDEYDESEYIDEFTKKYNFKNIKVKLKFSDFKKELKNIIKIHDEPIPNLTIFSEWQIFNKMKQFNIRVNLDGHAADEIFCGYENYFSLNLKNFFYNFKFIKILTFFIDIFLNKDIKNKKIYLIKLFFSNSFNEKWLFNLQKNLFIKKNYFRDKVLNENFNQFFYTSLPKQLRWSDLNSMAHSVETRSPFIDHKIVGTFLTSPTETKIKNNTSKLILRESLRKILPEKVYKRKFKVGFAAPELVWLKNNRKYIRKLFISSFKYCNKFLKYSCQKEGLKIIDGKNKYSPWIWKIIFLGLWIKKFKLNYD